MPQKYKDLTGKKFGRLTCIRRDGRDNHGVTMWLCECECGNKRRVRVSSLTGGKTKSCGCLAIEKARKRVSKHFLSVDENGNVPRLYRIWKNMKSRCYNPNTPKYHNHGGRGIRVCDEWQEYLPFHNWAINNGYSDGLTIERINNDGDYEPSNCKWVTYKEQNINKRDNRLITYKGKTKTLREWAQALGLKYSTLKCRLDDYSWSVEKAFTTPVGKHQERLIEYGGQIKSLARWAITLNIPYKVLHKRISNGWSVSRAFTQPLKGDRTNGNKIKKLVS